MLVQVLSKSKNFSAEFARVLLSLVVFPHVIEHQTFQGEDLFTHVTFVFGFFSVNPFPVVGLATEGFELFATLVAFDLVSFWLFEIDIGFVQRHGRKVENFLGVGQGP